MIFKDIYQGIKFQDDNFQFSANRVSLGHEH